MSHNNSTSSPLNRLERGPKCLQNGQGKRALRGRRPRLSRCGSAARGSRSAPSAAFSGAISSAGHQVELLRPHGGRAGDREDAVALGGGAGGGGDRRPRRRAPRPPVRGRAWSPARARREPLEGRGERARGGVVLTRRAPPARIAPGEMRRRVTRGVGGAGHVREVGGRDHALAAARQLRGEQFAALGVELAHDVVEQHQRRAPALARRARRARRAAAPAAPGAARPGSRTRAARVRRAGSRARRGGGRGRRSRARGRRAGAACSSATNSSSSRGARAGAVLELRLAAAARAGRRARANGSASSATSRRSGARAASSALAASSRSHVDSVACGGAARADARRAGRCAARARASTRDGRSRAAARSPRRPGPGGRGARAGGPLTSSSRSGRNTLSSGR